jgi:hypothetical protein
MSQLRVNGIANTGGTAAANLNVNGVVTEPNKPAFYATAPTGQGAAGTGAFNVASVNVNNCYSTSTYKFTAPVAGNYYFSCTALPNSSTGTQFFRFRKNDVDVGVLNYIINADEFITSTVLLSLAIGDLVHVHVYANGFEGNFGSFSGFLIG